MKCKVLVLTHGDLAESFVRTSKLILGEIEEIHYINMPEIFEATHYSAEIMKIVKSNQENGLLILTDLLGGSPFLQCSQIIRDYFDSVEIVTGCNLPMLLEVGNSLKEKEIAELKEIAIQAGRKGIVDFKEKCKEADR